MKAASDTPSQWLARPWVEAGSKQARVVLGMSDEDGNGETERSASLTGEALRSRDDLLEGGRAQRRYQVSRLTYDPGFPSYTSASAARRFRAP
jgi:hypothetical protein